jgi:hypothetical protein
VSKQIALIFFKTYGCEKEQVESVKKCDFGNLKNKQVREEHNSQFQNASGITPLPLSPSLAPVRLFH